MNATTMKRVLEGCSLASLGLLAACATTRADTVTAVEQPQPAVAEPTIETARFENPGGMWMPSQLMQQGESLKRAGLALDPEVLSDLTSFPLGAVVSLGGCSASFVSPDGLIVTNHHCVTGALQYNSTPQSNLLQNGFLASSRADEKWAGPTARVYVTTAFNDVTSQVLGGVESIADAGDRYEEIERRTKALTTACETGKTDVRCRVASYFEGAQYFQIEQLEIRDVRLVYAPHAGIGVFGGEIDNWRWPRHTGDYSFYRAYVGANGQPADHAATNVPYHPAHHLKVAKQPLQAGDFVMVAGYPGKTYRHKTAAEVREAVEWHYPRQIALFEQTIAALESQTKADPALAIKAASKLRGLNNYLTKYRGTLEGLDRGGLAQQKAGLEADLEGWIAADEARKAKYGKVFEQMEALEVEQQKTRERDAAIDEIVGSSSLLGAARTVVQLAQERTKPDAERDPEFQQRNWQRIEQKLALLEKTYAPELDRATFELALSRAAALPEGQRPDDVLAMIVGKGPVDKAAIDRALDALYAKTKLGDAKTRSKLLAKATEKQLRTHKDPFVKLAVALDPTLDDAKKRDERLDGAMAALRPTYIAALREFTAGPLAPDANSTLRITYGTVRGYQPTPEAEPYVPFTTVSQMVAKNTGAEPFAAPKAILDAASAKRFGPYADAETGELPVNFLADLDITGGNSGSATLNGRGELVGLVFDGNYEAMAGDWLFLPKIQRSIHVDIRYVLWVMDAVDQADGLLRELGVDPVI